MRQRLFFSLAALVLATSVSAKGVTIVKNPDGMPHAQNGSGDLSYVVATHKVDIAAEKNGKTYRSIIRDGALNTMLYAPHGEEYGCPAARQTARLTRSRANLG